METETSGMQKASPDYPLMPMQTELPSGFRRSLSNTVSARRRKHEQTLTTQKKKKKKNKNTQERKKQKQRKKQNPKKHTTQIRTGKKFRDFQGRRRQLSQGHGPMVPT